MITVVDDLTESFAYEQAITEQYGEIWVISFSWKSNEVYMSDLTSGKSVPHGPFRSWDEARAYLRKEFTDLEV